LELEELIQKIDIVDYVSQYVELHEENGELFGLSPFKQENTPSFSITPGTQLFYDFSAGFGGNVFTFVLHHDHCSAKKAIQTLKEYANVTEDCSYTGLSATRYIKQFSKKKLEKKFVEHRVVDQKVMEQYENSPEKLQPWIDEGITEGVLQKYLVRYDPFSQRIVFPIRDNNGTIIAVKGRTTDPDYKAKRLCKYIYFGQLGETDFLFGYWQHKESIQNKKEVIIFEGEKSVMKAEAWGVDNAVALMTSHLNSYQLDTLIRLGARVVIALDKDASPFTDSNFRKLTHFANVEYIYDYDGLLDEKDAPVDKGADVWKMLYERRRCFH
jgi:DNA primase